MEVSSPQLAQLVVAARIALAEAFVLKVGQTLQAVVLAGKSGDGLTLLKVGDQVVKAALPEALPAGTTLQLQVKSAGPTLQLAILAQKPPQGGGGAAATPAEPRLPPSPRPAQQASMPQAAAPRNSEQAPAVAPAISRTDSAVATRPELAGRPMSATPTRTASPVPTPAPEPPSAVASAVRPAALPAPPSASPTPATPDKPPDIPGSVTAPPPISKDAPSVARTSVGRVTDGPAAPSAPAPTAVVARPAGEPEAKSPVPAPLAAAPAAVPHKGPAVPPIAVPTPAPTTDAIASELVHPLLAAQASPRPPASVAELPRPVIPGPMLQPTTPGASPLPGTPLAALAQMLPEALARQDSVGPLLQSLATLVQKPAVLPEPVLRAGLGVLAQRVVATNGRVQPGDIERAVLRSGLGLEATLARGEPPAPLDAKAGLLALRAALTKWLGEAPGPVAQQRDVAPPPLKGLALRAPDLDAQPLPDGPRDALRAVHGQTDAAISRLKLMQMASLPDADPARPAPAALRLEVPLLIGHELVMAQLQVSRDGARREAERRRGWTMRFALNYSATGEVGAEVGLLGKAVNVALWAAEPETAKAMQSALSELGGALEAIGLKPGALRIRHGAPEPERPASGRLLDSVS